MAPLPRLVLLLLCLGCSVSCQRTPEPDRSPPPSSAAAAPSVSARPAPSAATSASAAASEPVMRPDALAWDVPSAWSRVEHPSPLRIATYRVARASGDPADAELTITRAGGSLEANIRRWKAQFRQAPGATTGLRRQQTVNGIVVTTIELRGTYLGRSSSDEPGAAAEPPRPDYAMVVVIAHLAGAPYFFKLVGPARTVDGARADLDVLVGSFRPK